MTQTIDDIPDDDVRRIRERLVNQILVMEEADLRIVAQSQASLAKFVADAFQAVAALLGYMIAVPIAWALNIVESLGIGVQTGFKEGYNKHRLDRS